MMPETKGQNPGVHGKPQACNPFSKVLKTKKLDKELNLNITQNEMSGRIFVEFSSEDGKLVLQKSFQGTVDGKKDAEKFSKTIKSIKALRKYFGIKE